VAKKEKGKFPLNFIEFLGDKENDFSDAQLTEKGLQSDAYLWGSNSNCTLGQLDTKNRDTPELVEVLHTKKLSILQIAVSKYHTVLLCDNGTVFSCGQGRGGRLGHDNEQTVLSPKRISALDGIFCTAVSNANDHTLILDEMGQVYSFGLNTYHQLGHYPVRVHCLSPKLVHHKQLKGKIMTGIAAARFHSAIYTKQELFTFGLNAGQLGHSKGDNWQSIPRLVSSIRRSDCSINAVAVSDGTTCCSLSNGDIFVLQDYTCRRIATKVGNIKKLLVTGGELRCQVLIDLHHKDPAELQVALLKTDGTVYVWRQGYGSFKECYWTGKKREISNVVDIALGKHLLLATYGGAVFHGYFRSSRSLLSSQSKSPTNRLELKTCSGSLPPNTTLDELFGRIKTRREDCEEVTIERVSLLYRAYNIACDVKSKTFAAIQNDPWIGMKSVVKVTEGTLTHDMGEVLREADLFDTIHDVIIKVKGGKLPAHRFILVSQVGKSISHLLEFDENLGKFVYDLKKHDMNDVQSWLSNVYTGKTKQTIESFGLRKCHTKEGYDLTNSDCELNGFSMHAFSMRDIESPDHQGTRTFCNENGAVHQHLPNASKMKKKKEQKVASHDNKSEAKSFEGKGTKVWKQMTTLSDVKIEAEDGSLFYCHKCILFARLDYFKGMFSSPWMESNWIEKSIKIQMPSRVLEIILDFAYTDEAQALQGCQNIDLLCDVILYADQWLVVRLKEICESSLTKLVSLKSAVDMLNFACTYNAEILKMVCCEFICNNLGYFLETRFLESLSPDILSQLSKAYKQLIPNMAYRIITPSMDCTNELEINALEEQVMQLDLEDLEDDADVFHDDIKQEKPVREKGDSSSRRKRRRRKSGSVRDTSFSEEPSALTNERDVQKPESSSPLPDETVVDKKEEVNGVANSAPEEKSSLYQASSSTSIESKSSAALRVKSLREIMKEEESVKIVENGTIHRLKSRGESFSADNTNSNVSIKWSSNKKKSQKQRKEELKSNGINHEHSNESSPFEKANSDAKAACPWSSPDATHVKSLKDVMNEEMVATTSTFRPPIHQNKAFNGTRRKLSWKGATSKPEPSDSTSNDGAWNLRSLAENPPLSTVSLSAIMKSQTEEKDVSSRILKKPLQLIQIEEKAIEDLLLHYNAVDNPTEYITVKRMKQVTDCPIWNVNDRS